MKAGFRWLETRVIGRTSSSKGNNVISFIRTIPISGEGTDPKGFIIVNINEKPLYDTLKAIDKNAYKDSFIIDSDGNIISHNDKSELYSCIKDERYVRTILSSGKTADYFVENIGRSGKSLIAYTTSKLNGWIYVSVTPLSAYYKNYLTYRNVIVYISIVCLVSGLLLIYFASVKIYDPIVKITENAKRLMFEVKGYYINCNRFHLDDYKLISETMVGLSRQVMNLKEFIDNNIDFTQSGFVKNFFDGKLKNAELIKSSFKDFGIDFKYERFFIFGIFLENMENLQDLETCHDMGVLLEKIGYRIINIMNTIYDVFCIDNSKEKQYLLFIVNTAETELPGKEYFNEVLESLYRDFGISVTITIGNMCDNILQLYSSHKAVFEAYKYRYIFGKGVVIYYDYIKDRKAENLLNINEICHEIVKHIKLEDLQRVNSIIDDFARKLEDGQYNFEIIKNYCVYITIEIYNTIKSLDINMEEIFINGTNIFLEYSCIETMGDYLIWLKDICKRTIRILSSKRKDRNRVLVDEVIEYVNKNIHCATLESVAKEFSLSTSYLSRLFKEITGENFNKYIATKKIELSEQLLCQTDISLEEIACRIGYNTRYFIRKFKEAYGQTPYLYRQNKQDN